MKHANVKVKNATPNIVDGIKFRSKLESYFYKVAKDNNLAFDYETKSYTVLPKFTLGDESIRPITYKPDFTLGKYVVECKGFANDAFPLRAKLFKYYLANNEPDVKYYVVRNQKEVNQIISEICQNTNTCGS